MIFFNIQVKQIRERDNEFDICEVIRFQRKELYIVEGFSFDTKFGNVFLIEKENVSFLIFHVFHVGTNRFFIYFHLKN